MFEFVLSYLVLAFVIVIVSIPTALAISDWGVDPWVVGCIVFPIVTFALGFELYFLISEVCNG